MKVIITPRAEADIASQHDWGKQRFGARIANRTFARVRTFIETTLADYPGSGRRLQTANLYECWIPQTPFVVFYRIDADTVWVLALFHHAQDRGDLESGDAT